MKVIVEQIGPCRKTLRIEVPAEQVTTQYQQVIKSIASRARLPGFRQGKAPAAIVEKQYSKDALEETRERLIPAAYQTALKQENIQAVTVVDVSDFKVEKDLPLSFKVTIDTKPDFALPPFKGITVTSLKTEVKEDDIEKVITNIRERNAHFEAVTGRAAGKEDVVEIDYSATCEGKPMSEVAPDRPELAQGKDFWVLLSDNMPEFLPGIKTAIEGIEVGQTREITINFPADYRAAAVAGKSAQYTILAKGLRVRVSPEMTDELAKTLGADSIADLRVKIQESLVANAQIAETNRQKDEIVKWLMEHTPLSDLPQSIVEEEARHIIQSVVQDNVRRGISKDMIESNREDIFTRAAQSAADRVKMNFIISGVADEEKIAVSDKELEERLTELASQYGQPLQKLKEDLEKNGNTEMIRRNLRLEKTVAHLHANATITSG